MKATKHVSSQAKTAAEEQPFLESLALFLEQLPERSRDIVHARFGMVSGTPETLEEIGRAYQITRERVRQVIGGVIGFLSSEQESDKVSRVSEMIKSTLEKKSGIMEAEELLSKLSRGDEKERGALLAFLECLSLVETEKATKDRERVYVLRGFPLEKWKEVKDVARKILSQADEVLEGKELYSRFAALKRQETEKEFFDFLSVAKDIKQNVFGNWGLSSWSDIKPRGTREKAYLVLKTGGKPMHFRDIAKLIDEHGLQGKKAKSHPQTVHNELIKDSRFVLVGRGIYGLSEWGFKKGTVKEVIEEILKKAGKALTREEVVAEVLKVRQVKKSTIIINLNTFFTRVGKNEYALKK